MRHEYIYSPLINNMLIVGILNGRNCNVVNNRRLYTCVGTVLLHTTIEPTIPEVYCVSTRSDVTHSINCLPVLEYTYTLVFEVYNRLIVVAAA